MTKKNVILSEYKDRWEEFYVQSGEFYDSREVNWRDVPWDKVVKVRVRILDKVHDFDNKELDFKFFINFRRGGKTSTKTRIETDINIWTVGWTDGCTCFLKDIDFYTGEIVGEYTVPLDRCKPHIHPAVAGLV